MKNGTSVRRWMVYAAIIGCSALAIAGGLTQGENAKRGRQSGAEGATWPGAVSVTGLVRQPLRLTIRDLRALNAVSVRRVDHRKEGFFGDFEFRGVPLATLISMAGPRKESSSFMRPTDLAVVVRTESGRSALFSYGELLFRPPADVILAFDGEPIMPKKSCDSCHQDRSDHHWKTALSRKHVFPRLIAGRDLDADRSLEGVTSIEVAELFSPAPAAKSNERPTASEAVVIREGAARIATARNLDSYPRREVHALEVGDAMGYHGEVSCSGALLADVLAEAKSPSGPEIGYVITAADGFRAMVSSAELFSTVQPPPMLIVDRCNGRSLGDQGRFKLVVANDTIAERWVKSVATIDVVRAAPSGAH